MINPSEGKQIQQDYLETLDAIVRSIREKVKSQGLEDDKNLSIVIGGNTVYKENGQEVVKSTITPEQVEMLNKALSEPQSLKGAIRIMLGREKLYHAHYGQVLTDKLGLSPKQSQAQVQEQSSRETISLKSLQQQIDALGQRVQEQQKLIDSLNQENRQDVVTQLLSEFTNLQYAVAQQQQTIDQLQQRLEGVISQELPSAKNSVLQNWVGSIETKIKQTATNFYERVKTALTPKMEKLQSQVDELKTQVNQLFTKLETQINDFKYQTQRNIQNVRSDIEQRIDSVKTDTYEALQDLQHKVSQQVQTVHKEVTKMAQSAHSKAVNSVREGVKAVSRTVSETQGKAIEAGVGAMLHIFGDRHPDGSVTFDSQNYHFHQHGNTISIKSKDGRDVFRDGNLTASATEKDIAALEEIQQDIDEYLSPEFSQSQTQRLSR